MNLDVNPEMIRTARLEAGMNQTEAGAALGIKQPTYAKIEGGYVGVTEERLAELCRAFQLPRSFFFQSDRIWGTASPHHRRRKTVSPKKLTELEAELNVVRLQIKRLAENVE